MSTAEVELDRGKGVIEAIISHGHSTSTIDLNNFIRDFAKSSGEMWTKSELLAILDDYYQETDHYEWLRRLLVKRPIRSLSGITSITVLTKPFPCPGQCVFCPVDVRMPKSYIASEPGAQRAGRLGFDPYQQVTARLESYSATGHPIGKIELIVLGGSWSAYDLDYQIWFIKRLFDALNDFGITRDEQSHAYHTDWDERITSGTKYNAHINASRFVTDAFEETAAWEELEAAQLLNENATSRCVGLSLETRPDLLDRDECEQLRRLGATKIQIGIQSLNDDVLKLNKRGHSVAKSAEAMRLLRQFGFKIHAHWMPNLYGATANGDINDFARLFSMPEFRPDELKVYPTVLIQDTELERIADEGKWIAYTPEELNSVLVSVLRNTPEYCRLTRIIRDIPSFEILDGNKTGNLRQVVESLVDSSEMHDIRAREIKHDSVSIDELVLDELTFTTNGTTEYFLQFIRPSDRKIAAFLRLSLPETEAPLPELANAAIIREVHVYGKSLAVGSESDAAQHQGLGKTLIARSKDLANEHQYKNLAVISAIGTREYYEKLGFQRQGLYQVMPLST